MTGRLLMPAGLLVAMLVTAPAGAGSRTADTAQAPEASTDLPDPDAWDDGPDREVLVRFARAFGQISGVLEAAADGPDPLDARLQSPRELDGELRRQVRRHIRRNGLDEEEWGRLLARMERDPDFRSRVEMLALPYQTPTE